VRQQASTYVYVPRASLFVYIYCLFKRKDIYCLTASRFLRFSKRIKLFSTQTIEKYYAKHIAYEKLIIDQCHPHNPSDCFVYQHYLHDSLMYLIPFYILSETTDLILIAPLRLKSMLFPNSTLYFFSVRDILARLRKIRVFSQIYVSISGHSAEVSYIHFNGSVGYNTITPWKGILHYSDIKFYYSIFHSLLNALMRIPGLEVVKYVYTRRIRESVEYVENLTFEYCELTNKISISEQERAFSDAEIDYSFSNYHEYRYWDYESRKIHQEFCRGNNVVRSSLLHDGDTMKAPLGTAGDDSRARRVLAFPAQIIAGVFNNSGQCDVHLAAEFSQFLQSLRDAGFVITIKLKDPEDFCYFKDFVCISSERGNYLDLASKYDYFISCGYTTPGIDLRVKGFRSFYYYPQVSDNRLYSNMTISNVQQFMSIIDAD